MAEEKQTTLDTEAIGFGSSVDLAMLRAVLRSNYARNITPVSVYRQPDLDGA